MAAARRVAITGAFSYTGRYLSKLALDAGCNVINLSSRSVPIASTAAGTLTAEQQAKVQTRPLSFESPRDVGLALEGCDVLFCTYWIRFALEGDSHAKAAERVAGLFELARAAGVRKVVFTSHTHSTEGSSFPYIAGKAQACTSLRSIAAPGSGMDYAIARPCGIFGETAAESILLNNAAWVLRRMPIFWLPGDGLQRFQPIHVWDMAELLWELGMSDTVGEERDACGPDALSAKEFFGAIAKSVGSRSIISTTRLSARAITALTKPINKMTGDILLDVDELDFLCEGLCVAEDPADPAIARRRSLLSWLEGVGPELGKEYVSSLDRYYKR